MVLQWGVEIKGQDQQQLPVVPMAKYSNAIRKKYLIVEFQCVQVIPVMIVEELIGVCLRIYVLVIPKIYLIFTFTELIKL